VIWIKIGLPLLIVAFLLKKKLKLEIVLPVGAFALTILFGVNILDSLKSYLNSFILLKYWNIYFIIYFVMILGELMDKGLMLDKMVTSMSAIFRKKSYAAAASAAFIGFLPMPGGSLLSAPFVEKLMPDAENGRKLVINYWFRHIWEYFFPLYSGMAWIVTVMKVSPKDIFIWMAPITIFMFIAGLPLLFSGEKRRDCDLEACGNESENQATEINYNDFGKSKKANFFRIIFIAWPILMAVSLSIIFSIPLVFSILAALILFLVVNPKLGKYLKPYIINKRTVNLLFLTAAIVFFGEAVTLSGVAGALQSELKNTAAPVFIFILPFIIGLLTGISVGFISIAFPILFHFLIVDNSVVMPNLILAYLGGFTGVMLSPTHLCLIVTTGFFKKNLIEVYPLILKSSIIMVALGLAYYFVLR